MKEQFKELNQKHDDWMRGYRSLSRYIANRDHSEKELKTKLSQKFDPALVQDLIQYAQANGWMPDAQDMAERTAQRLKDKGKGKLYIQAQLAEKGLPPVEFDSEDETLRAKALVTLRFGRLDEKSYEEKQKIAQFLQRRGFEPYICSSVVLNS
ncbi:MAG: regulatory protein RecX [Bdellovibrionales bacterium]|nr:regulatory protein RecX [Bdellovibrionales bacterium]